MLTIVATIFVFGIIVFIHEFGHFITAKASGMRVDEFAIGFGPAIAKNARAKHCILSEPFLSAVIIKSPVWIRKSRSMTVRF